MDERKLSFSRELSRLRGRLKDAEWRRYGGLLLMGKVIAVGILLFGIAFLSPDLLGMKAQFIGSFIVTVATFASALAVMYAGCCGSQPRAKITDWICTSMASQLTWNMLSLPWPGPVDRQ